MFPKPLQVLSGIVAAHGELPYVSRHVFCPQTWGRGAGDLGWSKYPSMHRQSQSQLVSLVSTEPLDSSIFEYATTNKPPSAWVEWLIILHGLRQHCSAWMPGVVLHWTRVVKYGRVILCYMLLFLLVDMHLRRYRFLIVAAATGLLYLRRFREIGTFQSREQGQGFWQSYLVSVVHLDIGSW